MNMISGKLFKRMAWMGLAILCSCCLVMNADAAAKASKDRADKAVKREKPDKAPPPGTVIFMPAKGHIDLSQGTVEVVFSVAHSFGETFEVPPGQSSAIVAAFAMLYDNTGRQYYWHQKRDEGPLLFFGARHNLRSGRSFLSILANRQPASQDVDDAIRHGTYWSPPPDKETLIKANQFYHAAATWKVEGNSCSYVMYFEGEKVKERERDLESTNPGISDTDLVGIGHLIYPQCNIQSLRISNRPRSAEEIAAGKTADFAKDDATTFLLNADTIATLKKASRQEIDRNIIGDGERKAKEGIPLKVAPGGTVFGDFKIMTTPDGKKAIQFFTPKAKLNETL